MKLLALGDIHIGSGQTLGRAPGDRLRDHNAVLDQVIRLATTRKVAAILVAGDVFEGPAVTPEQLDVFARFVDDAAFVGIPVVAISGNGIHDLAMRSVNGLAIFGRLPGITVYSRPAVHDLGGVQIACLPWVSPARLVATHADAQDIERERLIEETQRLLVVVASGLREAARPDVPCVLMLHGSLSGASIPTGLSTDQLGAVIDTHALLDLGFDAIVASHIHVAQAHHPDLGWTQSIYPEAPSAVIYTGSPLPLNFGETDIPHGVWILDVDQDGNRAEFVPVESRRLQHTVFDIADVPVDEFVDSVYDPVAWPEVDGAIVKVTFRCTQAQQRRLDLARLREAVLGAGAHAVTVTVEAVRGQRSRVESVTGELSPLAAFDAWVAANDADVDPELLTAARDQFQADLEQVSA